jgi:hypothetical protein
VKDPALKMIAYCKSDNKFVIIIQEIAQIPVGVCSTTSLMRPLALTRKQGAVSDVIPAKAGIQYFRVFLDSRLRGSDGRDILSSTRLTMNPSYRTGSMGGFKLKEETR